MKRFLSIISLLNIVILILSKSVCVRAEDVIYYRGDFLEKYTDIYFPLYAKTEKLHIPSEFVLDNTDVLEVDKTTGEVTLKKEGIATLSYVYNYENYSVRIHVVKAKVFFNNLKDTYQVSTDKFFDKTLDVRLTDTGYCEYNPNIELERQNASKYYDFLDIECISDNTDICEASIKTIVHDDLDESIDVKLIGKKAGTAQITLKIKGTEYIEAFEQKFKVIVNESAETTTESETTTVSEATTASETTTAVETTTESETTTEQETTTEAETTTAVDTTTANETTSMVESTSTVKIFETDESISSTTGHNSNKALVIVIAIVMLAAVLFFVIIVVRQRFIIHKINIQNEQTPVNSEIIGDETDGERTELSKLAETELIDKK